MCHHQHTALVSILMTKDPQFKPQGMGPAETKM